jgi:hypothetical protein
MDLIERYLYAVEFWLPTDQKQDILAELSEDIYSQVEERQAALGRDLNEDEIVAVLKERGRPVMVANRFQPQRYLIGPALFPIYLFLLKVIGFFYVVPGFVVSAVLYHTQHRNTSWAATLGVTGADVWTTALILVGVVTMIFATLQASGVAERELQNWNPRQLAPVKDRNRISRAISVTNIVANVIFLLWWIPCFSSLEVLHGPSIYLTLKPAWIHFYWGFLATGVFNIGLGMANLLHPHWTRLRASFYLTSNLGGGLLFCWMMRAHVIALLLIASLGTAKSALLAHTLDFYALTVCFPIVLIITVVVFMVDLLRVLRAGEQRLPHAAAGFRGSLSV